LTRIFIQFAALAVVAMLAVLQPAGAEESAGAKQPIDQRALFRVVGEMYGIDPELLRAIARVESAGRSDAVSPAGAVGLMQLMPSTAVRFDVSNRRDPVQSVLGAARFIAHLRNSRACTSSTGRLAGILAAYNAGEGAVCRYSGIPPYTETRDYVGKVLWSYLSDGDSLPLTPAMGDRGRFPVQGHQRQKPEVSLLNELQSIRHARASAVSGIPSASPGQQ
jgi:soluble lytic murein transglycosylase-like protein